MGESKSISFHSSWKLWKGGMQPGVGTEDLWGRSTSAVHLVLKVTGEDKRQPPPPSPDPGRPKPPLARSPTLKTVGSSPPTVRSPASHASVTSPARDRARRGFYGFRGPGARMRTRSPSGHALAERGVWTELLLRGRERTGGRGSAETGSI
ncbi:hypothetical protein D623_10021073 [Myotis brandtii]|uniref:Uncharacterized protein n=1 Tax=Myotis brandtii TaxID=109478 RepID=S7NE82_MYOBR|nr:hypothetical protein D623_10021073 [Myotis brandtii]